MPPRPSGAAASVCLNMWSAGSGAALGGGHRPWSLAPRAPGWRCMGCLHDLIVCWCPPWQELVETLALSPGEPSDKG